MDKNPKYNEEEITEVEGFYKDHLPDMIYTKEEAFVGILLAVAAPNNLISANGIIALYNFLRGSKTLKGYSPKSVSNMLGKMYNHLQEKGSYSLLDYSIACYSEKSNKRIFKAACRVVYSISEVNSAEEHILEELQVCMGLAWIPTMKIRAKVKLEGELKAVA